jgi:hypothetical protein
MKYGIKRHGMGDVLFVVRVERWHVVAINQLMIIKEEDACILMDSK